MSLHFLKGWKGYLTSQLCFIACNRNMSSHGPLGGGHIHGRSDFGCKDGHGFAKPLWFSS